MPRAWSLSAAALLLSQFFLVLPVRAAVFPDVPDGHLYQTAIESLASKKVITGNPDGSFKPEKIVNRAEMLAMLYRAAGKAPDATKKKCFGDVQPGSWYESYVCDAVSRGYVKGYDDGQFRPNREVNRVEALKMLSLVLGVQVAAVAETQVYAPSFVDVSVSVWYAPFLFNAYAKGILPIAGQSGPRFLPEAALMRGEAAAYIYGALNPRPPVLNKSSSSSSSEQAVQSVATRSRSSAAAVTDATVLKSVPPVFDDAGIFDGKKQIAYKFSLSKTTLLDIRTALGSQYIGDTVTCRLFRIGAEGFSNEYYLGYQEKNVCTVKAMLGSGDYQLEIKPSVSSPGFTVSSKEGKGDGNDGFVEAKALLTTTPRTDILDVSDNADWYKFTLSAEKQMKLELTNELVSCLIYPMDDVDIYGFSGPVCNESYLFPKGTYYIGVTRRADRPNKEGYTLRMN